MSDTHSTMKVTWDRSICEAHGLCMEEAPEVFRLDDDDSLHILQETPAEELRAKVEEAVRMCPRNALTLENA